MKLQKMSMQVYIRREAIKIQASAKIEKFLKLATSLKNKLFSKVKF